MNEDRDCMLEHISASKHQPKEYRRFLGQRHAANLAQSVGNSILRHCRDAMSRRYPVVAAPSRATAPASYKLQPPCTSMKFRTCGPSLIGRQHAEWANLAPGPRHPRFFVSSPTNTSTLKTKLSAPFWRLNFKRNT